MTVLTLGNFDGIHLGHRALLSRCLEISPKTTVLSFSNHPSSVLLGKHTPRILTNAHKLKLLQEIGIPETLLIPFTRELSLKSAEEFLHDVRQYLPFTHLILGHDAVLGKRRSGTPSVLQDLSQTMHFTFERLGPVTVEGHVVSSSRIRSLIQEGNLGDASKFLGRAYSIYSEVQQGEGRGRQIGFRTVNISLEDLVHPPLGVYVVSVRAENQHYQGVCNLGLAPTVKDISIPVLEVHLFDTTEDFYNKAIEVTFHHFLRSEQKFPSLDALRKAIENDITQARAYLVGISL